MYLNSLVMSLVTLASHLLHWHLTCYTGISLVALKSHLLHNISLVSLALHYFHLYNGKIHINNSWLARKRWVELANLLSSILEIQRKKSNFLTVCTHLPHYSSMCHTLIWVSQVTWGIYERRRFWGAKYRIIKVVFILIFTSLTIGVYIPHNATSRTHTLSRWIRCCGVRTYCGVFFPSVRWKFKSLATSRHHYWLKLPSFDSAA